MTNETDKISSPMPDPPENAELFTPVSVKPTSPRPDLAPRIAQMFERRHDWEAVFLAFVEWVAQGKGSDQSFALSKGIPYGTFARHASKFRRRMADAHRVVRSSTDSTTPDMLEAGSFSSLPSPTSLASKGPLEGLHSRDSSQVLKGASTAPSLFTAESKAREKGYQGAMAKLREKAPDLADRLLSWSGRMEPAAVAAIKEAFALLKDAERDSPQTSPFESMKTEEIGLLIAELWPSVSGEREIVLDKIDE